jgi:hypothetical protein
VFNPTTRNRRRRAGFFFVYSKKDFYSTGLQGKPRAALSFSPGQQIYPALIVPFSDEIRMVAPINGIRTYEI